MTSTFALSYQSFVDAGFPVVPVMPRSKAPGEFVGHWKAMSGWNSLSTAPADAATLAKWATWPGAGIGIVLGSRIGEDQIVAIDIDTNDPAELFALFAALPDSPMVKIGARGETRFFRASPDLKTQRFMVPAPTPDKPNAKRTVLEILTGNSTRQTVCPPTLHPDGMCYRWKYGCGLTKAEDLPLFTADHYEQVRKVLGALGYVATPDRAAASPNAAQDASDDLGNDEGWILFPTIKSINRDLNNQALEHLEWVLELGIYGTRRTSGGFEAVNTSRVSNNSNPTERRKRNLKIHRLGIVDKGTDETFTAIDLVMRFLSLSQDEAFRWLRERVPEPDDGVVIDFAVLSANIRKRMARKEAEKAAERGERLITIDDAGDAIDVLTGEVLPPMPVNDNDNDELPEHLTRPPGLLGALTDWIYDTARTPNRVISLGAAMTVIGTLAGRRDASPTSCGTSLFVLCLGQSGCGKQHGLDQVKRLLRAAGAGDLIGSGEFMSGTSVVKELVEKPLSLCPVDEFGSVMKRINSKKGGVHDKAITKVLRQAWGTNFGEYTTPSWANAPSRAVSAASMSLFCVSTPKEFFSSLEGADIENGTLNRFTVLSTTKPAEDVDPLLNPFEVPEDISRKLADLYTARAREFPMLPDSSVTVLPSIVIPWGEGAATLHADFKAKIRGIKEANPDAEDYFARTVEMAVRLATILAVGRNILKPAESFVVSAEDFAWGSELALFSSEKLARDASLYVSDTETGAMWAKITDLIRRAGGRISRSVLTYKMKTRKRDLDDALASMGEAGLIKVETETRADGRGGNQPRFYRLLKNDRAAA